jgi:hypothetical protein
MNYYRSRGKRSKLKNRKISCEIAGDFFDILSSIVGRLNDDRQGEGGTLAVIKVNVTMTPKKNQVF